MLVCSSAHQTSWLLQASGRDSPQPECFLFKISPKKHCWKPGMHRSQEGIRLEPSPITPRPVTLKSPAQPPNPSAGGTFPQGTERSRDAREVPWRGVPISSLRLEREHIPKRSLESPQSWGTPGLQVPARCSPSCRGRGHQRCLAGFEEKEPCRGEGAGRKYQPGAGKAIPGGFPVTFAHVWLRRGRKLQEMGVPRLGGGGRAAPHAGTAWDAPSCIPEMPWRAANAQSGLGLQLSVLLLCSFPFCEGETLHWELQFPQLSKVWSCLHALGPPGVCQPCLLLPFW